MKPETENKEQKPTLPERKPGGLFSRLFDKLDSSMKEKADKKTAESCCSGKDDKKGGGCC
jgi:hypothetical protein